MEDNESLIITIAEVEGWTECRSVIKGAGGGTRIPTAHGKPPNRNYEAPCPRYTEDLNAIHRVEKLFKFGMRNKYNACLELVAKRDHCFIWELTAKQKSEAFVNTLV